MKRFRSGRTTEFAVQLLSATVLLFTFSIQILIMVVQGAGIATNVSSLSHFNENGSVGAAPESSPSLSIHQLHWQQQQQPMRQVQLQKRSPFYPYFHHHFQSINKTLIVLPAGANKTAIKENFQQFLKLFSINLKNTVIDFSNAKGESF